MSRRRILLIEKPGVARRALAKLLETEGHEVRVADAEAVSGLIEDFRPDTIVYDSDWLDGEASRSTELGAAANGTRLISLKAGAARGLQTPDGASSDHFVIGRPVNLEELRQALRES